MSYALPPGKAIPDFWEVSMNTKRFLLPFAHGVDMGAIEQAVRLAKGHDAVLVPLSLISVQNERNCLRLESIQQSKDFLEAAKHKASAYDVSIEPFEVFTQNVKQTINLLASEMECDGIVLFLGGKRGILLPASVIKHLLETANCKLYIMRLQSGENTLLIKLLRERFARRFSGRHGARDTRPELEQALSDEIAIPM